MYQSKQNMSIKFNQLIKAIHDVSKINLNLTSDIDQKSHFSVVTIIIQSIIKQLILKSLTQHYEVQGQKSNHFLIHKL